MNQKQKQNMNRNSGSSMSPLLPSALEVLKPARRKNLAALLGVSALVAFALLFSRDARSTEPLAPGGYGLEGSWINSVNPILPPGVPPITFTTYMTVAA